MKNLLLFIYFTVVTACNLKAQTYNNSYLLDKPAAVFRGLHLVNDTLIAHGYIAESFLPFPVKYIIAKIGLDGTPLIGYSAMLDTFTDYFTQSEFIITKDSSYAFVGVKNTGSAGLFFKIKQNGTIEFGKEYIDNTAWSYSFVKILQLPDSCFIILGRHGTSSGAFNYSSILIKTDPLGNTLWKRKFVNLSDMPSSITLLQNGNILLSSSSGYFEGTNAFTNTLFRTVDTAGNLLNTWIDTTKRTYGANAYVQLEDNGGIYVTQWIREIYNGGGNPPTYLAIRQGYIVREDSLHNKLWELKIGQGSSVINLFQLKKLTDENFLAIGGTFDTTYTDGQPYKNTGWLIKFDIDGNIIWQRKYFNTEDYPGQTNYLYDFVELADGSIVAAGERIDFFNDYPQRGWLLRVDNFGCLLPSCESVGTQEKENQASYLSIFPNPVDDQLQLYFNAPNENKNYVVKFYSIEGKELYSLSNLSNSTTYTINTENFPKGIIIAKFYNQNQNISTQKIIKL